MRIRALVTDPINSIVHQSFHAHERAEPLNADGFGIAWYPADPTEPPALFRATTPAWSNQNLFHLARVTESHCILAHVRAATIGLSVIQPNCHPFAWGNLCFMHNGTLGGFHDVRRELLSGLSREAFDMIQGTTDSELIFACFVDHWQRLQDMPEPGERLGAALFATIETVEGVRIAHRIESQSLLNLAVTDGQAAALSRYTSGPLEEANSLYVHTGSRYVCENGVCRMVDTDEGKETVIVSSERLSNDPGWHSVTPNHAVVVQADRTVDLRAFPPIARVHS